MSLPSCVATLVVQPGGVLQLATEELPAPGPGDALVRMEAAPIHPADLNAIEGKYPGTPAEAYVGGREGAGVVEAVGDDVIDLRPGDRVILPAAGGTWREAGIYPAQDLAVVPASVPAEQAALLWINPGTAHCLLRAFVDLQPGEWIVQNAANSAVGRALVQLARHFGGHTVNLLRDPESIDDRLRSVGDLFLPDDAMTDLPKVTGVGPLRLACNAVGGESALRLANALADGGSLVTYGAMARQPLRIPNGLLIFRDLSLRGFWLTRWARQQTADARRALLAELIALAAGGVLHSAVDTVYPLSAFADALAHAARSGRQGKILFHGGASLP